MGTKAQTSRRFLLQAGGAGAAALLGGSSPSVAMPTADTPQVYSRIGVKPFINLTATLTINGGTLILPEVRAAMDEASRWSVNIDELMEKAGQQLAEWMGAEAAIVTSGAAGALTHATAACVAGGDPEGARSRRRRAGCRLRRRPVAPSRAATGGVARPVRVG